jgi:lipoate-protein ligase A
MNSDRSIWRLIPPIQASGHWQMAIDRWLLQEHQAGHQPPSLRFYTWQPVALSLGYFQQRYPKAWNYLTWRDQPVDIVQRPTGGRGVLHQGDLTYTVVTSGLKGTRQQNYEQICQFLINGWQHFGISLSYGQSQRGYHHNPNCFGTSTSADLVDAKGHKRIGSAQKYVGQALLQHGSMTLFPDRRLYRQVFGVDAPPPILPTTDTEGVITTLIATLQTAAQDCFGIHLQPQPITDPEKRAIAKLNPQP